MNRNKKYKNDDNGILGWYGIMRQTPNKQNISSDMVCVEKIGNYWYGMEHGEIPTNHGDVFAWANGMCSMMDKYFLNPSMTDGRDIVFEVRLQNPLLLTMTVNVIFQEYQNEYIGFRSFQIDEVPLDECENLNEVLSYLLVHKRFIFGDVNLDMDKLEWRKRKF